jgi:hypothetical protein
VHIAWLECVEAEDHELFAHLAGDDDTAEEPEMFVNIAGDADDDETGDNNFGGDDDKEGIFKALAVAGLDSLNWKAA